MRYEQLCTASAVSVQTFSQQRHSLSYITLFGFDPAAIDLALRTPMGETLLGRHRNQLDHPVVQRCVVSYQRQQPDADGQAAGQRRRMSQPPRLRDVGVAPCQCLVRKAETEEGIPQIRLRKNLGMN